MPVYDGGIRAYIGFLVDAVKARLGKDDELRDSKRLCDTMLVFA